MLPIFRREYAYIEDKSVIRNNSTNIRSGKGRIFVENKKTKSKYQINFNYEKILFHDNPKTDWNALHIAKNHIKYTHT